MDEVSSCRPVHANVLNPHPQPLTPHIKILEARPEEYDTNYPTVPAYLQLVVQSLSNLSLSDQ